MERAVREYLLYLEDPAQLVDGDEVRQLQSRVESAQDPIERLLAVAALERVRHPAETVYRESFVEHAKKWALDNEVPASAFTSLGVPADVLQAAGIELADAESTGRGRRQVSTSEIQFAVTSLDGPFAAADVVVAAKGGSPMTVRKALAELVDKGVIERLGPAPGWSSPGRAPILYRRT